MSDAVERALARRGRDREADEDAERLGSVCTLMVGRLDDWLKAVVERDGLLVHPAALDWAGIAVIKKVSRLFRERGSPVRPLAAAYRTRLHWTELIGGDITLTMPYAWQRRFNDSGIAPESRWDEPVPRELLAELETSTSSGSRTTRTP